MGRTDSWIWEGLLYDGMHMSAADLDFILHGLGIPQHTVDYYGNHDLDILHVAKRAGGPGNKCQSSSKLGAGIRISHDSGELSLGDYGNLVRWNN